MATRIFKENLNGKYDGVSPETLLEPGSVSGGKNMRKVGISGGWKPRKGCTLHNTTQISAHSIKSLHRFKHPRNEDYHFLAQINSLLYDATNDPPASGTSFGTSLGVTVGTTPGFSANVAEKFCYADGSGIPIVWGGDNSIPLGLIIYDASEAAYIDYSRKARDKRTDTKAIILGAATDKIYLLTHESCEGFVVDLGSAVNSNAVTLTVKAWRSGAWTSVSDLTDGTDSPVGTTLAQDGTVTWTRSTSDKMRLVSGVMGYAYEIGWSGAMSGSVDLLEITTKEDASAMTNKWNGAYDWPAGARFYDQSVDGYTEIFGKVSNESTSQYAKLSSMSTNDYLYIKTFEPATAFGLAMVPEYGNTGIGGAKAKGKITLTGVPVADETFVIDSQTFTWKASRTGTGEVAIGSWKGECGINLINAVLADLTTVKPILYGSETTYIEAANYGTAGNSIVFTEASTNMAMDGSGTLGGTTTGAELIVGEIDQLEYWDGDSWVAVTTNLIDTTKGGGLGSFGQTGIFSFDAENFSPQKRTLSGDDSPGYWYRLSIDTALSSGVRLYMIAYAIYPEVLPTYDGGVDFKNRLLLWGDPEFPNRLRFSATTFPDCFVGTDSGYTDAFGDMSKILFACKFYNELIVFKENSIYLLEGYSPGTFGILKITDTIGLASPKTVCLVETGYAAMSKEDLMTIVLWQATDGIYVFDGRKPKKVSLAVDNYFNPESGDCIAATDITSLQAFTDQANNEYHLLLPTVELVYNYVLDEWYPPWARSVALTTGLSFKGTDNRNYVYGANATGYIFRLENDTTDKTVGNVDVAIDHYIISRAISILTDTRSPLKFTLRRLWAELKARSAGTIVTTLYANMATTGVVKNIPEAMSMVNSGYGLGVPALDMSVQDCSCFKIKFSLNVADREMEIWGFSFEAEARGLLDR